MRKIVFAQYRKMPLYQERRIHISNPRHDKIKRQSTENWRLLFLIDN